METHLNHGDGLGMCEADKSGIIIPRTDGVATYYDMMGRQLPVKPTKGFYIESKNGVSKKYYIN